MQTTWQFRAQQLNPNVADWTFSLTFLQLHDGTPVLQKRLDGREVPMIYHDGAVIPQPGQ